jgi:hypothetical protein
MRSKFSYKKQGLTQQLPDQPSFCGVETRYWQKQPGAKVFSQAV